MTTHDTQTLIATFSIYLAICLALGFVAWRRTTPPCPRWRPLRHHLTRPRGFVLRGATSASLLAAQNP